MHCSLLMIELIFLLSLLSSLFGLETYYQNRFLNDAIYICGLWTYVYGGWLLILILARRLNLRRIENFHRQRENNVTESITFDEDVLKIEVDGVYSNRYYWNVLTGYYETKAHLTVKLGGLEIVVTKKYFSIDELRTIKEMLESKVSSIDKVKAS